MATESTVEAAEFAYSAAKQAVLTRRRAGVLAETLAEQARSLVSRRMAAVSEAQRHPYETQLYAGRS